MPAAVRALRTASLRGMPAQKGSHAKDKAADLAARQRKAAGGRIAPSCTSGSGQRKTTPAHREDREASRLLTRTQGGSSSREKGGGDSSAPVHPDLEAEDPFEMELAIGHSQHKLPPPKRSVFDDLQESDAPDRGMGPPKHKARTKFKREPLTSRQAPLRSTFIAMPQHVQALQEHLKQIRGHRLGQQFITLVKISCVCLLGVYIVVPVSYLMSHWLLVGGAKLPTRGLNLLRLYQPAPPPVMPPPLPPALPG